MHRIIKQPNGLYCVWSTIVDDFIMEDKTPDEIIKSRVEEQIIIIKNLVEREIRDIENGEKYMMTFDEAIEFRNEVHKGEN